MPKYKVMLLRKIIRHLCIFSATAINYMLWHNLHLRDKRFWPCEIEISMSVPGFHKERMSVFPNINILTYKVVKIRKITTLKVSKH